MGKRASSRSEKEKRPELSIDMHFFADEKNQGKSLKDVVAAWNEIKKKPGARKYVAQRT